MAKTNPFQDLYLTEGIRPDQFVRLFSTILVKNASALFQPGHVILRGIKGSGKTMLLSLLTPEVRIAFQAANIGFAVPEEYSQFIGAGINLQKSGIKDFGQRPLDNSEFYFGDFLNYWVVEDILSSILKYSSTVDGVIASHVKISSDSKLLDNFAYELAKDDCWQGALKGIKNLQDLKRRLQERILPYRKYLNFNIDKIPDEIAETKTNIGVPISKATSFLRKNGIINKTTQIYVRIDQYEDLDNISKGESYKQMIHKMLAQRDLNVSYRIGTRPYAWADKSKIYGTTAYLEEDRNFKIVDLENILRRKENSRTWLFPTFAEDIFRRRLNHAFPNITSEKSISHVFGRGIDPTSLAKAYAKNSPDKALNLEEDWPSKWKRFLTGLAKEDPLTARLGEAWARQKDEAKKQIVNQAPLSKPYPWEEKQWWKKERIDQALLQIASRSRQQPIWSGQNDIVYLSGSNILSFLNLCKDIWDAWLRDNKNEIEVYDTLPTIEPEVQSVGIWETSQSWRKGIGNFPEGFQRQKFADYIGAKFYATLRDDKAMSYVDSQYQARVADNNRVAAGYLRPYG